MTDPKPYTNLDCGLVFGLQAINVMYDRMLFLVEHNNHFVVTQVLGYQVPCGDWWYNRSIFHTGGSIRVNVDGFRHDRWLLLHNHPTHSDR